MDLQQILSQARVIAVVGCSGRPTRPSHGICKYLIKAGYTTIPVNPNYESVHGQVCFPDLASLPGESGVDIVNIFRNPRYTASVVRDAVALAARTGAKPIIWTQLGVSTEEARQLAEEADLPYVANRCILVEHSRSR